MRNKAYTLKDMALAFEPVYLPKHKNHCSQQEYKDINKDFYRELSEGLIKGEIDGFTIPHRFGEVYIVKKRTPKGDHRMLDFKKTNELGMKVYHNNTHSNGFYGCFYYDRKGKKALYTNKRMYMFEPTRTNKRALAREIKENNTVLKYRTQLK